jgi:hypothetical protein
VHDGIVPDLASVAHAPVQKTIILKIDDFTKGMWMLVHLLYVSQPVGPVTSTVTSSILKTSIQKNKESDITGVLCQGVGLWMQILEGERSKVNHLYSAVKTDPRHKNVELLLMEDIKQRQYKQWSMALVHLSKDDPLIQMQHPEFDPYLATGKDALKLIDDLINMGKPIVPDLR